MNHLQTLKTIVAPKVEHFDFLVKIVAEERESELADVSI